MTEFLVQSPRVAVRRGGGGRAADRRYADLSDDDHQDDQDDQNDQGLRSDVIRDRGLRGDVLRDQGLRGHVLRSKSKGRWPWLVTLVALLLVLVPELATAAIPSEFSPQGKSGSAFNAPVATQGATPNSIVSRDEHTGEQGYKRVKRLFRGQTEQVVYLRVAKAASSQRGRSERHRVGQGKGGSSSDGEEGSTDPDPDSQELRCTTEHPFWVVGRGWVPAGQLRVGDELSGSQGERLVVSGHEVRQEQADHYNFEVEDWHTYFVSETEHDPAVWNHNRCGPDDTITLYHGTTVSAADKIAGSLGTGPARGFHARTPRGGNPAKNAKNRETIFGLDTFFAEDMATAVHFGGVARGTRTPRGRSTTRAVGVLEFTIPRQLAGDLGLTARSRIGVFNDLPFVDVPGGTGFERVLGSLQTERFNDALRSGVIGVRRYRVPD